MNSKKKLILATTLSAALFVGGGATAANAAPSLTTHSAVAVQSQPVQMAGPMIRPALPGECWAQAGRVIGGFWGALISSAVTPWAAAAYFTAYLGAMAAEKKDAHGNFAC